jgi:hypothetical protein
VALYIPAGRRRRRTAFFAVGALVLGLLIGAVVGRASAPTATEKIKAVQADARNTAAALRVIALHDEAGAVSAQGADDAGIALVLKNTRSDLRDEFARAVWISPAARAELLQELDALEAQTDRKSTQFGEAAEKLAANIEATFGTTQA